MRARGTFELCFSSFSFFLIFLQNVSCPAIFYRFQDVELPYVFVFNLIQKGNMMVPA